MFQRSVTNPIFEPSGVWWEGRGVLNPGVIPLRDSLMMIYRAVGVDGISRFGRATSADGRKWRRDGNPWAEAKPADWDGRLGIEDPRITLIEGTHYLTYVKVGVEQASCPPLDWEPAPFHIRSWVGSTDDFSSLTEIGPVLDQRTTKDLVLFPEKVGGRWHALVREYPSIQLTTSVDLVTWSPPVPVMGPNPGAWDGERVGAGPPPVRVEAGWLLLYHGNEYLRFPGNRRHYRMGMALLDAGEPSKIVYRHPEPVFQPESPYEVHGPVGNVVFGTALIEREELFDLYYGAGDGVIAVASASRGSLLSLLPVSP